MPLNLKYTYIYTLCSSPIEIRGEIHAIEITFRSMSLNPYFLFLKILIIRDPGDPGDFYFFNGRFEKNMLNGLFK